MSASLSVWLGGLTVKLVEDPRWMGNQSIQHRVKVGNGRAEDLDPDRRCFKFYILIHFANTL